MRNRIRNMVIITLAQLSAFNIALYFMVIKDLLTYQKSVAFGVYTASIVFLILFMVANREKEKDDDRSKRS